MTTNTISTVVKMLEMLPESFQARVAERLREYIEDYRDEIEWDSKFEKTQPQLIAAARRARQEIKSGLAMPLDLDQL